MTVVHRKNAYFFQKLAPSFLHGVCTFCGTFQKHTKMGTRCPFSVFLGSESGSRALLRIRRACVFVESPIDCQIRVYDVFCGGVMSLLLEIHAFGGNAGFKPADPNIAHFFEHPTAACPRRMIHAGQKCPQFCGIGRSWTLIEVCLELVPQNILGRQIGTTDASLQACDGALSKSNKTEKSISHEDSYQLGAPRHKRAGTGTKPIQLPNNRDRMRTRGVRRS